MLPIDGNFIYKFAPVYRKKVDLLMEQTRIIEGMSKELAPILDSYEINTVDRISHFLAQAFTETQGFAVLVEEGDAAYFQKYDKRYGNTSVGDGFKYRGRGLFQITFRGNYESVGAGLGVDFVSHLDLVNDSLNPLLTACEFWKQHDLNKSCEGPGNDSFKVEAITRVINGGINGLCDRKKAFLTIKPLVQALSEQGPSPVTSEPSPAQNPPGAAPPSVPTTAPPVTQPPVSPPVSKGSALPTLEHGATGAAVKALETLLIAHDCFMNGTFTAAIQTAVMQFQQAHSLHPDGVVGPETWAKLLKDP